MAVYLAKSSILFPSESGFVLGRVAETPGKARRGTQTQTHLAHFELRIRRWAQVLTKRDGTSSEIVYPKV